MSAIWTAETWILVETLLERVKVPRERAVWVREVPIAQPLVTLLHKDIETGMKLIKTRSYRLGCDNFATLKQMK